MLLLLYKLCVTVLVTIAELPDPSDSTGQRGSSDRFRSCPGGGGASC